MALVAEAHASGARRHLACELLCIDERTVERWGQPGGLIDQRVGPTNPPSNAFTDLERAKILETSNSDEFANLPPGQIVPRLADQGIYVGSESTFYRVLKANDLLVHRSRSSPRTQQRPEALMATAPNQIWSWDITYLKAEIKGKFYYLYLPMDLFSRLIVHWEIHESESTELASQMIEKACRLQSIPRWQVTLHSDNGGPMKGATMLATLNRLGITASLSRPRVSDDNPFSEALFKTLKYCPSYPLSGRFENLEAARRWTEKFVDWYNTVHLHSGISWVTPTSRHQGLDEEILTNRIAVYEAAKALHPNRWSEKTRNWSRQNVVELNPGRSQKINKCKVSQQAS